MKSPEFQIGEVVQAIDWRGTAHPWARVVAQEWMPANTAIQTVAGGRMGRVTAGEWAYTLSNTPPGTFWLERCLHRRQPPELSTESWEEIRDRLKKRGTITDRSPKRANPVNET